MSRVRHQQRRGAQRKHGRPASLNLVSLMDIFTILVFFLMVNSSEVEVLQTSSKIKLPDSMSEQRPQNRLVVSVSEDDVVVQGRPVAKVSESFAADAGVIEGLREELAYQAERRGEMPEGGFEVTIMGDRELPYWLLKKIMLSCQAADFAQISLAVNRLSPDGALPAGAQAALGDAAVGAPVAGRDAG
ncbi:MAG: biopolymer transporter ExbD [Pseudomonadales bacterium]